jgi:hypothetical protein
MATPTYTLIDSVTLGSSAASVTFSSISQDFGDLVLVIQGRISENYWNLTYQLNNDTGSNYSSVSMGATSSPISQTDTGTVALTGIMGIEQSGTIIQFMDYSATDKHKTSLNRGNSDVYLMAGATRWANNAAITTIKMSVLQGRTYSSGTTFYLYGIEA